MKFLFHAHRKCHMFFVGLSCAACPSLAQTSASSVVDAGGTISSNDFFQNISAIGQGGPAGFNENTANRNHSGFLNTFVLHPELDTDADEIVDENDPDDDNDELTDFAELAGDGFDPTTSTDPFLEDSDGDGATDGEESVAGTNPLDPESLLEFVHQEWVGGMEIVGWKSRGGKVYEVNRTATVKGLLTSPMILGSFTAVGGVGPWFETITSTTNDSAGMHSFYCIGVIP